MGNPELMSPTSWIARVMRLAGSLCADHWSADPQAGKRWSMRRELRPDQLSVRRLEPRRVLNATIQSLAVPATAVEGETVEVSAEATGFGTLSFDWTITRDSTVIARGFTKDFSFEPADDGVYGVSLIVTDSADQIADKASASTTVSNAPPTIPDLTAAPLNENGLTTLSGTIQDSGPEDTHTLQINWGDPDSPGNLQTIDLTIGAPGVTYNAETREFSIEHQYLDDNPTATSSDAYTIGVKVVDDDGGFSNASTMVEVSNVEPAVEGLNATAINEHQSTTLTGVIVDPGSLDTFTLDIDWGDPISPGNLQSIDLSVPTAGVMFNAQTGEFSVTHQYLDDNPTGDPFNSYTIGVTVTDDDAGSSGEPVTTSAQVSNVAPLLQDVKATDVNEAGQTTLSGQIVDPGTRDTFSLKVKWGDGAEETFTYAAGTTSFSETHTYADDNPTGTPSDLVTIELVLTDDDTGQATDSTSIRVTNVAPTITELSATAINEHGKTILSRRDRRSGLARHTHARHQLGRPALAGRTCRRST